MMSHSPKPSSSPCCEEIALPEALKTMLSNSELCDLTLKSNLDDGKEIRVQRAMIAARSPVFYRMLYGSFNEVSKRVIHLNYHGDVLQAIVEYMYTGETATLNLKPEAAVAEVETTIEDRIYKITSLIDASNYFALKGLHDKAMMYAIEMIEEKMPRSSISVALLWLVVCDDTTNYSALLTGSVIEKTAMERICKELQMLLLPEDDTTDDDIEESVSASPVVGMLSLSRIESILIECRRDHDCRRNSNSNATTATTTNIEFIMFKILHAWATSSTESKECRLRMDQAKELLIKHVDLTHISEMGLSTTVASSGLVLTEQLDKVYKEQAAIATAKEQEKAHSSTNKVHWKSSNSHKFSFPASPNNYNIKTEVVNCDPLTRGHIYKWSILIDELALGGCLFALGVVAVNLSSTLSSSTKTAIPALDPNEFITIQNNGWTVESGGGCRLWDTWIDSSLSRSFHSGSTITFTLDLTTAVPATTASMLGPVPGGAGYGLGGSLMVSVDDKPSTMLCSNVMSKFSNGTILNREVGFLPVVSYCPTSPFAHPQITVQFLGFE